MAQEESEKQSIEHSSLTWATSVTLFSSHIGAGTGPAGPAIAGPFSAEVET